MGSNLVWGTCCIDVCRCFPQCLQANAGVIPWLDHDNFLLNTFQFIIHVPPSHPTLYNPVLNVARQSVIDANMEATISWGSEQRQQHLTQGPAILYGHREINTFPLFLLFFVAKRGAAKFTLTFDLRLMTNVQEPGMSNLVMQNVHKLATNYVWNFTYVTIITNMVTVRRLQKLNIHAVLVEYEPKWTAE
jgi:hypothetical protein